VSEWSDYDEEMQRLAQQIAKDKAAAAAADADAAAAAAAAANAAAHQQQAGSSLNKDEL
jgi:hypothetical protein